MRVVEMIVELEADSENAVSNLVAAESRFEKSLAELAA